MKRFSTVFSIVFLLYGCSSLYTVYNNKEANKELNDYYVIINLKTGESFAAKNVMVLGDSVYFTVDSSGVSEQVSITHLSSIQRNNYLRGALECLFLGAAGGGVIGYGFGSTVSNGDQAGLGIAISTLTGIAIGGVAGLITGATSGHELMIKFAEDSSGNRLEKPKIDSETKKYFKAGFY